jgi:uncharacterized RDD family membrane protein YckC
MTESAPHGWSGNSAQQGSGAQQGAGARFGGMRPHAFDPDAHPDLFEGVPSRRVIAFLIDFVVIAVPVGLGAMFIFAFGLVTLGLGWALFWLLSPASVIWALFYYGMTFGSERSATIGMRVMNLEMRTWYGAPSYFVLGAVHAIVFWCSVSFLTPLVLFVCFFNTRRRLLHDMLLGTVVVNSVVRARIMPDPPRMEDERVYDPR